MGVVSVPGMSIERRTLRRRGLITVAVFVVVLLVAWGVQKVWPKDESTLTLRTPSVAAGIVAGAPVRLLGLQIGSVEEVKRIGNGQQGVVLKLDGPDARSLTNNVEAAFSAGNLFGVSEVILTPHEGGGEVKDGAELAPTRPITDNTVSNMIVTIGDVNNDALRPNMSQILLNFDASSKALLPMVTAIGGVVQAIQDTQRLSTSQTFPVLVDVLAGVDQALAGSIIPAAKDLFNNPLVHDQQWLDRNSATLTALTDERNSLTAALQQILDPKAVGGLQTVTPLLVNLMKPILTAFPNGSATGVGIQIGQLLDNVRAAMPNTPNGPVFNVRLSVDFPAIAAMVPPPPQFAYVPPGAAAPRPGAAPQPAVAPQPGAAARPAAPSATTQKPGS